MRIFHGGQKEKKNKRLRCCYTLALFSAIEEVARMVLKKSFNDPAYHGIECFHTCFPPEYNAASDSCRIGCLCHAEAG